MPKRCQAWWQMLKPQSRQHGAWRALRGMSEDRLETLSAEYVERFVQPQLSKRALALIDFNRTQDRVPALVGAAWPAPVLRATAAQLGIEHVWGPELELHSQQLTGRLLHAPTAACTHHHWLTQSPWLPAHRLDTATSYAGDIRALDLLTTTRHACALNPDRRLRRVANQLGWPVLDEQEPMQ